MRIMTVVKCISYLAQLCRVDCLWALIDKLTVILGKAKIRLSLVQLKRNQLSSIAG